MEKEEKVISVRMKNRWLKLDMNAIREIFENFYKKTKAKELGIALMNIRDFYRHDEGLMKDAFFVIKLLQLEASGYVEPPVNFAQFYQNVVVNLIRKEKKMEVE